MSPATPVARSQVPRDAVVLDAEAAAAQPAATLPEAEAPAAPPPAPIARPAPEPRPAPAAPGRRDVARATHYPVTVTVVSRGTSLPLRGVDVRVHVTTEAGLRDDDPKVATGRRRRDRFPVASAVTEDDGRARFLLAPGVYVVTLGDAWSPTSHRIVVTRRTHVVVEVDDALNRQPLTVTVTRRGVPVGGTRVQVQGGWEATTGPDGTCLFLLPAGTHHLLVEGESLAVAHRGEGTVVFALPEKAVDVPDDAWEPAPPETWDDDPFTILTPPRPPRRPPKPVVDEAEARPRPRPRAARRAASRPTRRAALPQEEARPPSRYEDEESDTTSSFTTRVTWDG